jgi:hypothetical protein
MPWNFPGFQALTTAQRFISKLWHAFGLESFIGHKPGCGVSVGFIVLKVRRQATPGSVNY